MAVLDRLNRPACLDHTRPRMTKEEKRVSSRVHMSLNLCHSKFPLCKECLQMECKQNYLLVCAIKWAESTGMNLRTEPYTCALADACSYISDLRRQLAVHLEPILSFPSGGEEQQCLLMVCRKSQTPIVVYTLQVRNTGLLRTHSS